MLCRGLGPAGDRVTHLGSPLSCYGHWVSVYAAFCSSNGMALAVILAVDVAENGVMGADWVSRDWHGAGSPVMGDQGGDELANWALLTAYLPLSCHARLRRSASFEVLAVLTDLGDMTVWSVGKLASRGRCTHLGSHTIPSPPWFRERWCFVVVSVGVLVVVKRFRR